MPTTFVVRTPAYRKEGNVCEGNLSRVSLARSVTRPQATGFALQNRTNTKKDTQKRVFFRVGTPDWIRTSGLQSRSFQAHPDKVLCFQGLYGFWRECSSFLNDCKTIENTEEIGFWWISDDSSQIVVTVISLPEQHFRKNIKTRCLQNYKQRIFICRSIIKIVSNHILSLLAAARKYTDKIETTSSDSG